MKTYTLPISPSYVAHWGFWEAMRELIQNAFDQRIETGCSEEMTYIGTTVSIKTDKGQLSPSSLVLGNSTKSKTKGTIGQFGEGYKLALLVLTRLGHRVKVYQHMELWTVNIVRSHDFDCDVLEVKIHQQLGQAMDGVIIQVEDVTLDQWNLLNANVIPDPVSEDTILDASSEAGRIYVGGLYVTTNKDLKYGYSFLPSTLRLDRDRGMVASFDLVWQTSRMWEAKADDRMMKLIEDGAPDVEYIDHHAPKMESVPMAVSHTYTSSYRVFDSYVKKYGPETVPCTTNEEVKAAMTAGSKWTLVPKVLKSMLSKVYHWFIPSVKSPVERLKDLLGKVDGSVKAELEDIIKCLEP